ncbi:hypothetical protein M407DRAFT_28580 [Tulasnella calospora MUT 4182]|uniref:Uncharacterized protein n=1 Tax=Tulasnella calospora MUT 4182 TaxID=1051891 RepID=A0A0C3QBT9_9AGAM|nr:hypothetical protein M407DRAFT_28580 [Tulasnella calospora MUT 4182]
MINVKSEALAIVLALQLQSLGRAASHFSPIISVRRDLMVVVEPNIRGERTIELISALSESPR